MDILEALNSPNKYCSLHDNIVKYRRYEDEKDIEHPVKAVAYCPACVKWDLFGKLGYKVYHKEVERFHNSDARVKVCWAPRRTTKSYSAAHDLLWLLVRGPGVSIMTGENHPDCRVWIVAPNYGLAEKEFRVIYQQLVINPVGRAIMGKPRTCLNNFKAGQLLIAWDNGSVLEGKSADNLAGLLGDACDAILYSEAAQLPRSVRERYTMQTVTTRQGVELIPTTPFQSAEWVKELCDKGQEREWIDERLIQSFHWDISANPEYDPREFEIAKKSLGVNSPQFREQYLGEWVFYGGSVYAMFNHEDHVIDPFKVPAHWPVVRAIDFGIRDPFVCLWLAVGPSAELYLIKEYHSTDPKSIKHHTQIIKENSIGMNIIQTVGDPSSAQQMEDMNYEGLPIMPADNDISSGRMRVIDYLAITPDAPIPYHLKDVEDEENKSHPRLYVFNTCHNTLREIQYYRFNEAKPKEGDKERTLGEDHCMDALRYACKTRPAPFRKKTKLSRNTAEGLIREMRNKRLMGKLFSFGRRG